MRRAGVLTMLLALVACATETPSAQSPSKLEWRANLMFERDCSLQPYGDLTRINWFRWQGKHEGKRSCYALVAAKDFESRFIFCTISTSMLESTAGVPASEVLSLPLGCSLTKIREEYQ